MNEIFTNNEHFVAMMNIINEARSNPPSEGHRHHIIPRCWFKKNNLDVDNSDNNLVLLSYEDHIKVHELLYHCCTSKIMKSKMAYAYNRLTEGKILDDSYMKGENHPNFGKKHSAETKRKMSEAKRGENNPSKRPDVRRKLSEANKGKVLSEEHKRKIGDSKRGENHPQFGKKGEKSPRFGKPSGTKGKSWKLVDGKRIYSDSKI